MKGSLVVKHEDGWRYHGTKAVTGQKTRKAAVIAGLSFMWNKEAEIIENRTRSNQVRYRRPIDKRRLGGGLATKIHKIILEETGALKNKNSRWAFIHHMSGKVEDEHFRTIKYSLTGGWLGISGGRIYNECRGLRIVAYDADINARTRLMVAKMNEHIQKLLRSVWG